MCKILICSLNSSMRNTYKPLSYQQYDSQHDHQRPRDKKVRARQASPECKNIREINVRSQGIPKDAAAADRWRLRLEDSLFNR